MSDIPTPSTVEGKVEDGVLRLKLNALRLDAAIARDFKASCETLWQPEIRKLVINLASVEFLDSSGVGALLSLYKKIQAPNPSVVLTNVRPTVNAVIELLRLQRVFEVQR